MYWAVSKYAISNTARFFTDSSAHWTGSFRTVRLFEQVIFRQFGSLNRFLTDRSALWTGSFQTVRLIEPVLIGPFGYLNRFFSDSSAHWTGSFRTVRLFEPVLFRQFGSLNRFFSNASLVIDSRLHRWTLNCCCLDRQLTRCCNHTRDDSHARVCADNYLNTLVVFVE